MDVVATQFNGIQPVYLPKIGYDAFSRYRVSNPVSIFDDVQLDGDNALVWENSFTGTGAVTNLLNEATVQMTTGGTANGAQVIRQTRQNFRYQPGHSQLILQTFAFDGGVVANNRRRVGYFNEENGFFFELSGSNASLVRRTFVTGSAVDNSVAQASWNLDPLNGSGPSGITLSVGSVQILVIDLQWLGVGRVRVGFDIGGNIIYVHEFLWANLQATVYMGYAMLPLRYEITNTGVAGSTATMRHICAAIISEGGADTTRGLQFSAATALAVVGVTTRRPVISIRPKTTSPAGNRNRGWLVPHWFQVTASTNDAFVELVLNGALTGASFSDVNSTYSRAQKDTSATAISGGVVIQSLWVPSGAANSPQSSLQDLVRDFALVYTGLGNVQDTLSVIVTSVSGTTNIHAALTWQEHH